MSEERYLVTLWAAMHSFIFILDLSIIFAAALSAQFWLQASRRKLRRVSKFEEFDHADINRMVIALNRSQLLNGRAAAATAIAALLAGIRAAVEVLR